MIVLMVLLLIVGILLCLYLYMTWNYNKWKKLNIPHEKPRFIFGNIGPVIKMQTTEGELVEKLYHKFDGYLYFGFYYMRKPLIVLRDPGLIETVLVKEFSSFHDNDFDADEKSDPVAAKNPFVLKGDRWKVVRNQIIVTFTPGKMKAMFPLMEEVCNKFADYLLNNPEASQPNGIDVKDVCMKYTVDNVASCAFGIDAETFTNSNSEFAKNSQIFDLSTIAVMKFMAILYLPFLAKFLRIPFFKEESVNFFRRMVKENIKYREDHKVVRNDFMNFMIKLREKNTDFDFNEEHMVSHVMSFFTDGTETSSITLSSVMYMLAKHRPVLDKLRAEIDRVLSLNGGQLTYDALQDMKYMDYVIMETSRLFPAGGNLRKRCTQDFYLPHFKGNGPELLIKKGDTVKIPLLSLHRDPKYFPDPEKFDPDRFSEERKHAIVKCTFLPFGEGPRQCLGQRFAMIQMKAALATVISKFDLKVSPKMKEPVRFDPKSGIFLVVEGGIWLSFHPRKI